MRKFAHDFWQQIKYINCILCTVYAAAAAVSADNGDGGCCCWLMLNANKLRWAPWKVYIYFKSLTNMCEICDCECEHVLCIVFEFYAVANIHLLHPNAIRKTHNHQIWSLWLQRWACIKYSAFLRIYNYRIHII